MLQQWFHRAVPERGASIRRGILVGARWAVTVLWLDGLAQDWGAQLEVVRCLQDLKRTQLSLLLRGRGYFDLRAGPLVLRAGDAVLSEQALGEAEGYFGEPGLVLIVEWDDGGAFGPAHQGDAVHARLSPPELARLTRHAERLGDQPPLPWVVELTVMLRAYGLDARPGGFAPGEGDARPAPLLDAMGVALSHLDRFPSLGEVAGALGVGERQARRRFHELVDDLAQPYDGWRDFLADARLGWVTQLLSLPDLTQARIAELSGFRSPVALAHAFSARGGPTPGRMRRELLARWR